MISNGHDRRVKKIIFTIPAQADVRRIDRETAMRILTALHRFAETGELRLRVGEYRVRFSEEQPDTFRIHAVLHRREAYR